MEEISDVNILNIWLFLKKKLFQTGVHGTRLSKTHLQLQNIEIMNL